MTWQEHVADLRAACEPGVAFWLRAHAVAADCAIRGIGSPRVGVVDTTGLRTSGEQILRRWPVHRRSMRSALVLVAVATLTLAACGSKSTDSGSSTSAATSAA